MSRVNYHDEVQWPDDSSYQLAVGRFEHARRQVLTSRRGQAVLRELRAALLALPTKRLIDDDFATAELVGAGPVAATCGDVCLVGALALHKGYNLATLALIAEDLSSADATADWAQEALGLRWTLAWVLVELNDEIFEHYSPEERYERVLAWVDACLEKKEE